MTTDARRNATTTQNATPSRRTALKTGMTSLAAASIPIAAQAADQWAKRPGETKIVAVMGDYWHHPWAQENHVRQILGRNRDWRILFTRASRFFTPELISDADLLITARYAGRDDQGWSTDGIVDSRIPGDEVWRDDITAAVVENVRDRGMGFLAVHCTLFSGRTEIEELIGIEPILHQEIQPVIHREFNQNHPITRGMDEYFINLDEQFDGRLRYPDRTTVLFRTLAVHDKRNAIGGWCMEQGKGRIVGLLPGHTQWAYREPHYQEIFWRSAHWAMNRSIPPYPGA